MSRFIHPQVSCSPAHTLIIKCSLVRSTHINWPGEKKGLFLFQSHIVSSGNVYLDVNQPAKVLYPASVWRVGFHGPLRRKLAWRDWDQQNVWDGVPCWGFGILHHSLHKFSIQIGHSGSYTFSTPFNTFWLWHEYGAFVIALMIGLLCSVLDAGKGAHPSIHKEHATFPWYLINPLPQSLHQKKIFRWNENLYFPDKLTEDWKGGNQGAETVRVGEFWELWLEVWEIWVRCDWENRVWKILCIQFPSY